MVAFVAVKMISGLLPLAARKLLAPSLVDAAVGVILAVGGGVLLATVFIHMIPEAQVSKKCAVSMCILFVTCSTAA